MNTFEEDLERAVKYHGHLCSGQLLGVRMARMACRILKIEDPVNSKRLIVYVENDRCLADAIGTVTGCKLGKRTLKWKDFGKSAATFVDLENNHAVRLHTISHLYPDPGVDILTFFGRYSDEELFAAEEVKVDIKAEELPGPPLEVKVCEVCYEEILDGRHVIKDGKVMCRHCAGEGYYTK